MSDNDSSLSIIRRDPLLLPAAGDLRGGDGAVEPMDRPAMFGSEAFDLLVRKHREHELPSDRRERVEQPRKILFVERAVVMSAIAADIGRIDEVERFGTVVAADDIDAVFALDRNAAEASAQLLREGLFRIAQFQRRRAAAVVAERSVYHRGEAQLRADPHRPSPLDGREKRRMLVDMPSVRVDLAAVERSVDHRLECRILRLRHAVEVHQFGVRVVDDLALRSWLGEQHGAAAAEGFRVKRMFGNQRQDMLQEHLLAAIV